MTGPRVDHSPFGADLFGRLAERFARFFGTPGFIIGQTLFVVAWIVLNTLTITRAIQWDRPWYVLLNLLFSTQAAYAAPLILLAQTRQADRDKRRDEQHEQHRERIAADQSRKLDEVLERMGDMR